ncbi:MAG: pyridoxamine 5'-phosphate oxidase family protein, partial [Flavobacteriales bacterium]|nr:pyridoxamine 5'-phosphate oxidase family protein [Flavobacteriales bacterium]
MNRVYHSGEIEIQQRVGEESIANANGRVVTDAVISGAINFIEKQPMAIVSSANLQGQIWTSLLIGDFGFTRVPNANTLTIDKSKIYSASNDVFYQNIKEHPEIGSLFLELSSRRRFRINGVTSTNGSRIDVKIHEAYPNCPKYIQRRVLSMPKHFNEVSPSQNRGKELGLPEKNWIEDADTLFVGSQSNEGRMDASHRGGNPGFIEIIDDHTLKIPDYQGNSMYNTLGNFVQNPNAGILLIDF